MFVNPNLPCYSSPESSPTYTSLVESFVAALVQRYLAQMFSIQTAFPYTYLEEPPVFSLPGRPPSAPLGEVFYETSEVAKKILPTPNLSRSFSCEKSPSKKGTPVSTFLRRLSCPSLFTEEEKSTLASFLRPILKRHSSLLQGEFTEENRLIKEEVLKETAEKLLASENTPKKLSFKIAFILVSLIEEKETKKALIHSLQKAVLSSYNLPLHLQEVLKLISYLNSQEDREAFAGYLASFLFRTPYNFSIEEIQSIINLLPEENRDFTLYKLAEEMLSFFPFEAKEVDLLISITALVKESFDRDFLLEKAAIHFLNRKESYLASLCISKVENPRTREALKKKLWNHMLLAPFSSLICIKVFPEEERDLFYLKFTSYFLQKEELAHSILFLNSVGSAKKRKPYLQDILEKLVSLLETHSKESVHELAKKVFHEEDYNFLLYNLAIASFFSSEPYSVQDQKSLFFLQKLPYAIGNGEIYCFFVARALVKKEKNLPLFFTLLSFIKDASLLRQLHDFLLAEIRSSCKDGLLFLVDAFPDNMKNSLYANLVSIFSEQGKIEEARFCFARIVTTEERPLSWWEEKLPSIYFEPEKEDRGTPFASFFE